MLSFFFFFLYIYIFLDKLFIQGKFEEAVKLGTLTLQTERARNKGDVSDEEKVTTDAVNSNQHHTVLLDNNTIRICISERHRNIDLVATVLLQVKKKRTAPPSLSLSSIHIYLLFVKYMVISVLFQVHYIT
jgi:hypothetical protein